MKNKLKISAIKGGCLIISCFFSSSGLGEVTLDGSMGTAGALNSPDYEISEDLGRRAGNNLFHSFGRFNLDNTETATFSGSSGINNVIGRVTGGFASRIDGTLRVTIPDANLYLLNPAGILFGKNVKLDIPGSFHASTADTLKFHDGVQLNSRDTTANPILTTAAPEAFGFLEENPANISLTGDKDTVLGVPDGKTLSLVGGDITIKNSSLYALGGQINLASVGSTGDVGITESGLDTASFEKMGNINISQNPLVAGSTNVDVSADAGGKIFIRGGQLVLDNADVFAHTTEGNGGGADIEITNSLSIRDGGEISTSTFGEGDSGDLMVRAQTVDIDGGQGGIFTGITNQARDSSSGDTGYLALKVERLNIRGGGQINASIFGSGNGGDLWVKAQTIDIDGGKVDEFTGIKNVADGGSTGNAGNLMFNVGHLEIRDSGEIRAGTFGSGDGGDLMVKAETIFIEGDQTEKDTGIVNQAEGGSSGNVGSLAVKAQKITIDGDPIYFTGIRTQTAPGSLGKTDDLMINVDRLEIRDDGDVSASSRSNQDGGNLRIKAQLIVIDGRQSEGFTGITNQVLKGAGNGGDLTINVDRLNVLNGGGISASTTASSDGDSGDLYVYAQKILIDGEQSSENTRITNQARGSGNTGDLTINVDRLEIRDGGQVNASTFGNGRGGDLKINAQTIFIDEDQSDIFTGILSQTRSKSFDSTGGDLTLNVYHLEIRDGGEVSASTLGNGSGGDLTINAQTIFIDKDQSGNFTGITNQARQDSSGDAGSLMIITDSMEIRDMAEISASTFGVGRAGNLIIKANNILLHDAFLLSKSGLKNIDISENPDIAKSGNVEITVTDTLHLENNASISVETKKANAGMIKIGGTGILKASYGSEISTSVASGDGTGGDISITTPTVVLDGSSIKADADEKMGGDVTISGFLFKSPLSKVTASSRSGLSMDGEIKLEPDTNISGSITVLPDRLMNAPTQLSDQCTARTASNASSFVIKGSDKESYSPGVLAPSNFSDYTAVESISIQESDESDALFHILENNNRMPLLAGGCNK